LLELPELKSIDRAQESHPSALAWFESALSAAKGKHIVMFLDYDGTLSPIVKDPDDAVMSDEVSIFFSPFFVRFCFSRAMKQSMLCPSAAAADPCRDCRTQMRDAVRRVAEHFPTAIVSGRCIDKVPFHSNSSENSLPLYPCLLAVATSCPLISGSFFLKKKCVCSLVLWGACLNNPTAL
jgi:hypothetical protein